MLRYISTKGGVPPVDFEAAVLQGFAGDGGMFVPEMIPQISADQLQQWSDLSFIDLAFEDSTTTIIPIRKKINSIINKININTADKNELTKITGIGPSKAEKIIAFREMNGRFKSKEDLLQIKGIGKKTLEKISDQITLGE